MSDNPEMRATLCAMALAAFDGKRLAALSNADRQQYQDRARYVMINIMDYVFNTNDFVAVHRRIEEDIKKVNSGVAILD
jgi:hypothetical protein